jgi:tRNA (cmo5U34)-methyltransferase
VKEVLSLGAALVLADVVVPDDPADAVTPLSADYDMASTVADQLAWLDAAGFDAGVTWRHQDLAVLRAVVR